MAQQVGDSVASCLKRQAGKNVSMADQKTRSTRSAGGNGKFGDIGKGGPSGGSMGAGGKRKGY